MQIVLSVRQTSRKKSPPQPVTPWWEEGREVAFLKQDLRVTMEAVNERGDVASFTRGSPPGPAVLCPGCRVCAEQTAPPVLPWALASVRAPRGCGRRHPEKSRREPPPHAYVRLSAWLAGGSCALPHSRGITERTSQAAVVGATQ